MWKKILSMLLCLVMMGLLVACDNNSAPVVPNLNDYNTNNNNSNNSNNK